jgi:alpha-beta hydrolase superfamily lysophospholipase
MKINKLIKTFLLASGALAVWEITIAWLEKNKFELGATYWQTYFDSPTVEKSEQIRQVFSIESTGAQIHIDVYPGSNPDAPVVIFNHGAAGYCRLFVVLTQRFNARGYTVVLPDQKGQGLSGGRRGDYTITECTQNIVDVAKWARARYAGPIFMAGGSVGGGLTYYAAVAGAPVDAIACLNLFDFGNGLDGLQISRLAPVAKYPQLAALLRAGFELLKPLYWLRVPFNWFGAFDKLMDARDTVFQAQWDADPVPPRLISLRALASNLNTSPAVPFEANQIPTLVINQALDQMVAISITRQNYERLAGEKSYLEVPFGHWSSQPEFWNMIVQACDEWFQKQDDKNERSS